MKQLKEIRWDAVLLSALYIILGIVVLVFPETTAKTLGYLLGVVLILAGAVSMICYLLREAHLNYYHNDFLVGLVEITLGCVVLYKVEWIISLIPFILGLLVLVSGCSKLQDVIDMKRMNYGNWVVMLILAAANVVFGVVLICNPFQAAALFFRLIGVGLLFSGISDGITMLYFSGKLRKYFKQQQTLDSTYEEINK